MKKTTNNWYKNPIGGGKKLAKRIVSITLCMAMMVSVGAVSAADTSVNVNDIIIKQALEQYDMTNTDEFTVVALQGQAGATRSAGTEYALQSQKTVDGQIQATTLIPFKVLDDGSLMNSFEYAATVKNAQSRSYTDGTWLYGDVTVKIYAVYDYAQSGSFPFYRINGMETSWRSNGSQIYKLDVSLDTIGDLHAYPALVSDMSGSLIQAGYHAPMCQVHLTYPISGQIYSDYGHGMPSNAMLRFSNPWDASLAGFSLQPAGSTQVYTGSVPILHA